MSKQPRIRFSGFTDDWVQCKLGEIADFSKGRGYSKKDILENGTPIILYGRMYTNYELAISNVETYAKLEEGSVISQGNEVIIPSSGESAIDIAIASAILTEGIIIGGDLNIAKPRGKYDSVFLALQLSTGRVKKEISKRAQGKSVVHVNSSDLKNIDLSLPPCNEQVKIGQFFKTLDDTIALHQRKLDALSNYKKVMLTKIFPKDGNVIPDVRFAGFTDNWVQCRLGDISTHRGGTAIEKYFSVDGKYKVISIGSYGVNSEYVEQNLRAVSNEVTDKRVVNANELTMVLNDKTSTGEIIGRCLLIKTDDEYVVNQRTEIISPNEKFDPQFAYVSMNGPFREKIKKIVQGGTQIYVNYSSVEKLTIELPQYLEQAKIGQFFKTLDDTIALHQQYLEKYKKLKVSMLSKMFV